MRTIIKLLQQKQDGQVLILAVVVVGIIMINTIALIGGSMVYSESTDYSVKSQQALDIAEAGVDKAYNSLNSSGGSYTGDSEKSLGAGTYTVAVSSINSTTNQITVTSYIPNKAKPEVKRTISVQVSKGAGTSFTYGVQVGDGGAVINGGSRLNGSIYSNNNIALSGGAVITGDAYVAGGTQSSADQQTDCTTFSGGSHCSDFNFGKTVGSNVQLDVAQSFKPTNTLPINKVSLRLKKVGNPSNPTVRILGDNTGKPSKSPVIASGTLLSSLVGASYGFVDVTLTTNPTLNAGTTYWIVIDTSSDNTNYWYWSYDTLPGDYTNGASAWSPDWQKNPNPVWTSIVGDFGFKVYMGGVTTSIAGSGSGFINGSAYADSLTADNSSALQIGKDAYYQSQSGITVQGSSCTSNTHCHPGSTDPASIAFPISDSNITDWKNQASGQVINGNQTIAWPCTTTLQKAKYVGNVTVQGGCSIQIDTPVWITGNLTISNGSTVSLKSSYGTTSGVIVADGIVNLTGGSRLQGSGTAGSYMMALSTYTSPGPSFTPAVSVDGGNSSSIVYAPFGIINLSGGATLREATAYKLSLTGGAVVTYEAGLANPNFTSGPTGSFSIIKGTYQQK